MCSGESDFIISLDDVEPVESVSSLFAKWQDSEASLYKIISEVSPWDTSKSDKRDAEQDTLLVRLDSLINVLLETPSRTPQESLMKLRVWVRSIAPRDHLIGLCTPSEQLAISAIKELENRLILKAARSDPNRDRTES